MTEEQERAAFDQWFEAWRVSTWVQLPSDPRKECPAHFNTNCKEDKWKGWQARAALSQPQASEPSDEWIDRVLDEAKVYEIEDVPAEYDRLVARAIIAALAAAPQSTPDPLPAEPDLEVAAWHDPEQAGWPVIWSGRPPAEPGNWKPMYFRLSEQQETK